MPYLSVIVPIVRIGGLDVLFDGLERQTFRDFELVLSDMLHPRRKQTVAERATRYSFPIRHVEPVNNRFPLNCYSHVVNSGVVNCTGEIAVITCDYMWLDPECLAKHATHHRSMPGTGLMGMYRNVPSLPIHPNIPHSFDDYGPNGDWKLDPNDLHGQFVADAWNKWADKYEKDYLAGTLDPFMWSVYDQEFLSLRSDPRHMDWTDQGCVVSGAIPPQYSDLKNDSVAVEALLRINGLDEDFDGSHGWQDSEVAERLTNHCGIQWYGQPDNLVYKFPIHFLLNARRVTRISKTNEDIFYAKRASGYPPVNSWNLRETRTKLTGI